MSDGADVRPGVIELNRLRVPVWPKGVMSGIAGQFATTYSQYMESPQAFLYMSFLTFLGHMVSDKVVLQSEAAAQPRLFTILLGESADARKSTAILKTHGFLELVTTQGAVNSILGVGSAEGLAACLKKGARAILILDELKSLIQKMRIDSSILLPCINSLFENNQFHSATKRHTIAIDNADLCILAASTIETYRNMFTASFTDIGFLNRLFIVIGDSRRRFSIPPVIPAKVKADMGVEVGRVLSFVAQLSAVGCYQMPFDPEAHRLFDFWYFNHESSSFVKRLETYGHRLMVLLAVNEMSDTITREIAEKAIQLLDYQIIARKYADPVEADTAVAKVEEKIRRALLGGGLTKRQLQRATSSWRPGIELWNKALYNLVREEEVAFDAESRLYSLID